MCIKFTIVDETYAGKTGVAIGWGTTTLEGSISDVLQKVTLPIISNEECQGITKFNITSNVMCTKELGK